MTCSEHVGIPTEVAGTRGSRYYDPLATFGFLAGLTQQIRFVTHVLVMPYHHPLALAKRYGTLDRLCGGRLVLGVGVGSLREEFELLGAEFSERGARYADALRALRAAWGERQPRYAGEHYGFDDFVIDPTAVEKNPTLWLGGRSALSLRRALVDADGWSPFRLRKGEIEAMLERARDGAEWSARTRPFDVALGLPVDVDLDTSSGIEATIERAAELERIGATTLHVSFESRSLEHHLELLEAFWQGVVPKLSGGAL